MSHFTSLYAIDLLFSFPVIVLYQQRVWVIYVFLFLFIVNIQKTKSSTKIGNVEDPHGTIEEVNKQILQHEKSAASILCQLRTCHGAQASLLTLTKDVVGIVAMLGKVEDENLSRYLRYRCFLFGSGNHALVSTLS